MDWPCRPLLAEIASTYLTSESNVYVYSPCVLPTYSLFQLDIFITGFLLITCLCLIKTRRSAPTLTAMNFAFAVVVFIILFYDMGFNILSLIFAAYPEQ
ncbi:hypothetical protein Y032_0144g2453 [Ancylostoma ceylanicum]|uniref:Uncharacterized protein n=1 Tax=Ancylostoma ceylanicum TaxID=53326 RepID=A0A016T2Z4_9BILA|nr:hypothetical protein Y032_0144g2453 [Ancylostoma ceylanicum]